MEMPSPDQIKIAAQLLRAGGLVAFPTETVYGLGANAADPLAVRRIFEAKGRPATHPLIIHLGHMDALRYWARDIPAAAWRLAEQFWPGPLTLILRRQHAPLEVTGGQDTVGLRVPDHPVALALLEAFGGGIAAPSANRFGRISPTRAEHVRRELRNKVDMILDGGPCRVGVESTILSLVGEVPKLLRPGMISLSSLRAVLGDVITATSHAAVEPDFNRGPCHPQAGVSSGVYGPDKYPGETDTESACLDAALIDLRAPGMLASHYAPETQLELWPLESLKRRSDELARSGLKAAAVLIEPAPGILEGNPNVTAFSMPAKPSAYAQKLYDLLRLLDSAGYDLLLMQSPPDSEAWQAVNDRLRRASCNHSGVG